MRIVTKSLGWEWLPTPVFLPGESHGQRSQAGYIPLGRKESDMTEVTWCTHTHTNELQKYCQYN